MKVAIVGSRNFNNYDLVEETLNHLLVDPFLECIISGGAIGADKLGEKFADENNIQKKIFLPDWNKHGKSAGFKRNVDIISNCDVVYAFWDGKSKGTKHSIDLAEKMKKVLYIINI